MSKFAKCQTQANCQECPAVAAHLCDGRGKDSNPTKEFCRSNSHVPNRKLKPPQMRRFEFSGRGERIRTFDILVPNQALYQTELHPENNYQTAPLSRRCFASTDGLHPETTAIITAFFLIANFSFIFISIFLSLQ